ncbi:MAG: toxin-antitoxin system HicB family antitoxin [Planctomycetes bacterium]|nr:toxin-antitoxin system HicB family antitoxin [Planctomycetota bacterium]
MTKRFHLRLAEPIHRRVKELAEAEGVSINQFLVMSASNEVVRQETRGFFRAAAARFSPAAFAEALGAVPDARVPKSGSLPSR